MSEKQIPSHQESIDHFKSIHAYERAVALERFILSIGVITFAQVLGLTDFTHYVFGSAALDTFLVVLVQQIAPELERLRQSDYNFLSERSEVPGVAAEEQQALFEQTIEELIKKARELYLLIDMEQMVEQLSHGEEKGTRREEKNDCLDQIRDLQDLFEQARASLGFDVFERNEAEYLKKLHIELYRITSDLELVKQYRLLDEYIQRLEKQKTKVAEQVSVHEQEYANYVSLLEEYIQDVERLLEIFENSQTVASSTVRDDQLQRFYEQKAAFTKKLKAERHLQKTKDSEKKLNRIGYKNIPYDNLFPEYVLFKIDKESEPKADVKLLRRFLKRLKALQSGGVEKKKKRGGDSQDEYLQRRLGTLNSSDHETPQTDEGAKSNQDAQ